jgi:hypothetical protein
MRTSIEEAQIAAQSMHLQLQLLEVDGPAELQSALSAAKKNEPMGSCKFKPEFCSRTNGE